MTFSTKTAYNSAMLMVKTLKLSSDVGPHQSMILRAKVKVTRTFSTKKLDNLAMLGDSTLKPRRGVGSHQWTKVKVKVTMFFSTKKLTIRQCLRLEHLNLDGMYVLTIR